jgi:hypothetical protein
MNLNRMLRVSSIAAGVGVAGVFGTTIAAASSVPGPRTAQACAPGSRSAGPPAKRDRRQRKAVGK